MLPSREEVAALFYEHASGLGMTIVRHYSPTCYDVEMDQVNYRAAVFSSTRGYYDYRFHLLQHDLHLLIVFEHDTYVDLPVLSLEEGYIYASRECPNWYDPNSKQTRKNAMVLVGGLLAGVEEAFTHVRTMKRTTKLGYMARMQEYLKGRPGRQLEV